MSPQGNTVQPQPTTAHVPAMPNVCLSRTSFLRAAALVDKFAWYMVPHWLYSKLVVDEVRALTSSVWFIWHCRLGNRNHIRPVDNLLQWNQTVLLGTWTDSVRENGFNRKWESTRVQYGLTECKLTTDDLICPENEHSWQGNNDITNPNLTNTSCQQSNALSGSKHSSW